MRRPSPESAGSAVGSPAATVSVFGSTVSTGASAMSSDVDSSALGAPAVATEVSLSFGATTTAQTPTRTVSVSAPSNDPRRRRTAYFFLDFLFPDPAATSTRATSR